MKYSQSEFKTIEELTALETSLVEVELMLTPNELKDFANYCIENDVKFNDWVRSLAYNSMQKSKDN